MSSTFETLKATTALRVMHHRCVNEDGSHPRPSVHGTLQQAHQVLETGEIIWLDVEHVYETTEQFLDRCREARVKP